MDKKSFNIIYENQLDSSIMAAVNNVFKNYRSFLNFNDFSFSPMDVKIGQGKFNHFQLSKTFSTNLVQTNFNHLDWFKKQPLLIEDEKPDYIGTCFYLINCLQEYEDTPLDFLGRFSYENSYQHHFSCADKNLVLDYFQEISHLLFGKKIPLKQSSYHLSHDIDFVNSAWKDEIKNTLKSFQIGGILSTIKQKKEGKDNWQNLEKIIQIEKEKKLRSTFFWLVSSGKTSFKNVSNADYEIEDVYIQKCRKLIQNSALHQEGLHKSISSQSIDAEIQKLGTTKLNRFHYLKFNIKEDFPKLQASNIEEDYSLGFSKTIGFRNSYGLPFYPYNPLTKEQYTFQVHPLHIMDSALYYFENCKTSEAMYSSIQKFIQKNKYSCQIGVLWHNNFFEEKSYTKLLDLILNELV